MTRDTLRTKLREYAETVANGYEVIAFDLEDRILEEFDRLLKAEPEWHDAEKDPPKEEGYYWVVGYYKVPPTNEPMPCTRVHLAKYNDEGEYGCFWDSGGLFVTKWQKANIPPMPPPEGGAE